MSDAADPPRITAITPTRRDPDRVTVKVDGRAVATLSAKRVDDLGLVAGDAWSDELAGALDAAVIYDKAWRDATRGLGRRALSRRQVRDKLRKREHPPDVIDRVIHRLEELDLVDDEAFGRLLIDELRRGRPAGPRLLRHKLLQKGVDPATAQRLVAEATADADPADEVDELIRRAMPGLERFDAAKKRRRLHGLLSRRGYPPEVVFEALGRHLSSDDAA